MSSSNATLLTAVLALPVDDRRELVEALLASLPPADAPPLDEAWRAVFARRSVELKSGQVAPIPWAEVKRLAGRRSVAEVAFHPEAQAEYDAALAWYHGHRDSIRSRSGARPGPRRVRP